MTLTFNPYYQAFKRFLFKKNPKEFNSFCENLACEVDNLFCVICDQGNVKFIRQSAQKLLGMSINKKYTFIFFEMYGPYIEDIMKTCKNGKSLNAAYVEFPIKNSADVYVWLRLDFQTLVIEDRLLITITAKDITKKRELLEQSGENNLWSKSLVENIKLGIIMEDENRKVLFINRKFMDMFGFKINPDDLVGTSCVDAAEAMKDLFVEPDAFIESINKTIHEKKDVIDEILRLKNGQIFERSFFQFKSDSEAPMRFWIYNEVTEYHKLLNLLTHKEARYRGIIENTQLGVLESDEHGNITNASDIFCEMTGYSKEQLIGTNVKDGPVFDRATIEYFSNLMMNYVPNVFQKNAHEFQLITKNGDKLWVLVSIAPSFNLKGEIISYTGFYYDISDRKVLEESLRTANAISRKAEESEKLFVASMTHELKTPINAIVGMGDLLKLTPLNEEQNEYVEILDTSTKYLQKLVSDILDMSKIESGAIELRKDPFNLMDLLLQIIHSFDHTLTKNNINFKIKLDFKPNLEILGDKVILQQIISNLLSNAEKFTTEGSISLIVEQTEEIENIVRLKFKVVDTGIGFNEDMKELIFEKFTQLPSINQHKSPGTGLGLNIVKQLLAFQGSTIEVNSKIGEGTEFYFEIAFEKNTSTTLIVNQYKKRSFDNPFDNLKVLVVEDNELNLQYISKVLRKWSIDFDMVTSGESALIKFGQDKYDLVLLDIQLPGINGFETAQKLRALFQDQLFTIIAMTAVVTVDIEREILKFGMNDILRKPFSMDDLYDKLAQFFLLDHDTTPSTAYIPFHNSLDNDFLHQFYGDDYVFALSVFETFRNNYLAEFKRIIVDATKTQQKEVDFKLHSMKPSFKMVGLTDIEQEIERYITAEANQRDELTDIFPETKIASMEIMLDSQIDTLKKSVNN